jgi:hypothetical protein
MTKPWISQSKECVGECRRQDEGSQHTVYQPKEKSLQKILKQWKDSVV